jgi:hypothetical protein
MTDSFKRFSLFHFNLPTSLRQGANQESECTDLGSTLIQSTQTALEESGWQVSLGEAAESKLEGTSVKIEIAQAISSGNAFMGHNKSVTIFASLYNAGKVVDTRTISRDSRGGFMGGFKGSCAVLYRCADTLGKDLSAWINKTTKNKN